MKTGILLLLIMFATGAMSQDLNKELPLEVPEFGKIQKDQKMPVLKNPYNLSPYQDHFNKNFKKPRNFYYRRPHRAVTRDSYTNMPVLRPGNTDLGRMPVMVPDSTVNYAIREYRYTPGRGLKPLPYKRK